MTIRYSNTYHEVICDCGQRFFVQAGRSFTSTKKSPNHISTVCPGCKKPGAIRDLRKKWAVYERVKRTKHHARILFEDLPDMERCLKMAEARADFHYMNWLNLQTLVGKAIDYWHKQWDGVIMPYHFKALVRCLQEQRRELLRLFPAEKDAP